MYYTHGIYIIHACIYHPLKLYEQTSIFNLATNNNYYGLNVL